MTYTVKKGDTLSQIALSYGVNTMDLANANGILNPNYIKVGQVLTIPVPVSDTEGVKYADIGRAFVKALDKLELLDEFKELSGLLDG